ncbi:hypothetical protein CDA63_13700 [Hymenobacter amundsenii]|uniref:AsmA-like C-terminal domain-containing protein n=1 Tax=Hymenobacter amundsenii TaxID=2006685 RepID=A0A246FJ46_9BACT|nr:hypothetical protein [Hymenobacter amundsenii]OWP62558.1 hypothetical protein CDA63_13700 [Hymenobacter amundsenii]
MKFSTLLKLLAGCVLGVLLVVGAGLWVAGSEWGRQQLEKRLRARLSERSDLVLGPLQIDFSLWHDFPHLTASVQHVQLTDTSFGRSVQVLRVGRADLRLALRPLWHGLLEIERLTLRDAEFRQLTDSAGHDWGLRGRGPRLARPKSPPDFDLDSLLIYNLRVSDRNELHNSGFAAHVTRGGLVVRVRDGQAQVRGLLTGELEYLRSSRSLIFARKVMVARVRYGYDFQRRQGTFRRTLATLNGDTVRVSGTHRGAGLREPRGTHLNLRFAGNQPLLEVLRVALPAGLDRYLEGAQSPSHAQIEYTIRGLSGPTVRPRTVLRFALRDAQVRWPDSDYRIRRWDARGAFDNGPAHASRTTYLTFEQCRLYSTAGQLDARLTVRDFTRPRLQGHITGRTELQTVAIVVVPELWRARSGQVALDLELDGWLPDFSRRAAQARGPAAGRPMRLPVAVRGTVRLEHAFFDIPSRQAEMRDLNVRVGLRDSLWRLENLSGRLNGMQLQANATTTNLLAYASGQHPSTRISGEFAVDELRLSELRRLLAAPRRTGTHPDRGRPRPPAREGPMQVADMMNLLPEGLLLNVGLRCSRLVVGADTLRDLAATVQNDGHRVALKNLRVRAWSGQISGAASWRTDTTALPPVQLRLKAHFPALDYQQLLARITRPPRRQPGQRATDPTLREILLDADGQIDATIERLQLPGHSGLEQVALRIDKDGSDFRIPAFTFRTNTGGTGQIQASATLAGIHLAKAQATVELRYGTLDVQRFLQLLAALGTYPAPDPNQPRPPRGPNRRRDVAALPEVRSSRIRPT